MPEVVLLLCEMLQEKDKPHTATALVIKTPKPGAMLHAMYSFFTRDCVRVRTEKTTAMSSSSLYSQVPYLMSPCLG